MTTTTTTSAQTTTTTHKSYKVGEDARTLRSAIAYIRADIDAEDGFKAVHPNVMDVQITVKECKSGKRLEMTVKDDRLSGSGIMHFTMNSTASIDWRKVDARYEGRVANLVAKQALKPARAARKSGPTKAEVIAENAELKARLAAIEARLAAAESAAC